jgi:hypothetical protein
VGVDGVLVFHRKEGMRDVVWQVGVRGEHAQHGGKGAGVM